MSVEFHSSSFQRETKAQWGELSYTVLYWLTESNCYWLRTVMKFTSLLKKIRVTIRMNQFLIFKRYKICSRPGIQPYNYCFQRVRIKSLRHEPIVISNCSLTEVRFCWKRSKVGRDQKIGSVVKKSCSWIWEGIKLYLHWVFGGYLM